MYLTTLLLLPLVGSIVVAFVPMAAEAAKKVALGFALATLAVGIYAATKFDFSGMEGTKFQLAETHSWIPQFGVSYALGVDGIALALILMALVLLPVCLLAAWKDVPEGGKRERNYYALLLLLGTFMVGVFAATDLFLFYVFFEAMLIPLYFLIGSYGGEGRQAAAMKFLLFSLFGGLVMLVAVIALYAYGPGGSEGFLLQNLTGLDLPVGAERLIFLGFFIAFAIKAPMVPVHTWLPDTAAASKPAVATLLVAVLDKIGTYGMIRFCLELLPGASKWATPVVVTLAVISVLYGAILAIGQQSMMRLVAFTSVSHFGLIVLGIFALTTTAGAGSSLYMVNHGFSTAALFLVVGMLVQRRGTDRIADFGGWQRITPALAGVFLVSGLAALSLPGLSTFVSEFLVLAGSFQRWPWLTAAATLGVVLSAIYILWMYKKSMTGPKPELSSPVADLGLREKVVVAPLIAAFLVLGFYPKPALDLINPAVKMTLTQVGATDPAPSIAGSSK